MLSCCILFSLPFIPVVFYPRCLGSPVPFIPVAFYPRCLGSMLPFISPHPLARLLQRDKDICTLSWGHQSIFTLIQIFDKSRCCHISRPFKWWRGHLPAEFSVGWIGTLTHQIIPIWSSEVIGLYRSVGGYFCPDQRIEYNCPCLIAHRWKVRNIVTQWSLWVSSPRLIRFKTKDWV